MGLTDDDGTPLRRAPDGDLVPDTEHPELDALRRRDAIRRCREAITRTRQENQ
ncbi:hypothetical protein G5V59_25655 [Nocardioides sp. W3-2-3]|uniref:hypothetical protein n=1 Tax=Nocardioides convexus TaxID=2712224 RepID=UPI0024186B26|nr:hypothetical protein [Nocardioides convexus]NHA01887.1 hypothetical protein [Nocardioides convexus]